MQWHKTSAAVVEAVESGAEAGAREGRARCRSIRASDMVMEISMMLVKDNPRSSIRG